MITPFVSSICVTVWYICHACHTTQEALVVQIQILLQWHGSVAMILDLFGLWYCYYRLDFRYSRRLTLASFVLVIAVSNPSLNGSKGFIWWSWGANFISANGLDWIWVRTLVVKGDLGSIEGKDATDQNLRSVWEDGRPFRRILEILKVQLDSNVALKEKEIGQPVYLG